MRIIIQMLWSDKNKRGLSSAIVTGIERPEDSDLENIEPNIVKMPTQLPYRRIPRQDQILEMADLKDVEDSFKKTVVLDLSCFWSKENFDYVLGVHDIFKPEFVVPGRMMKIIENGTETAFIDFMVANWEGKLDELHEAWPFISKHYKELRVSELSKHKEFGRLYEELKEEFPDEYDILYEIIESSYLKKAFILGFGNSDPSWYKKLFGKTKGEIRVFGTRLGSEIKNLHDWKNKNIKPKIKEHPKEFALVGGAIAIILVCLGAPPVVIASSNFGSNAILVGLEY